MFELRCTVRGCSELLHRQTDGLFCSRGHHFDRSKQGYWNLLQPQDSRSVKPGDTDAAVLARQRWLMRGHMAGLVETILTWIADFPATDRERNRNFPNRSTPRTLDLGCGEGSFGRVLFAKEPDGYCGIDLSKRAIKLAARAWPEATWVLANADRILPAADKSVDRIVSLFGRRPVSEIGRVLIRAGICIFAVPGEDDLIELREHVQTSGHRRSRWEVIVEQMSAADLDFVEHKRWQHRVELESDAIADALAMTYRAVRHSQQARLENLTSMEVTLSADLLLFSRRS